MEEEVYKQGFFNACIREIRTSDYGRDVRKPIADALERIGDTGMHDVSGLEEVVKSAFGSVELTPILGMDDYYTLTIRPIGGS